MCAIYHFAFIIWADTFLFVSQNFRCFQIFYFRGWERVCVWEWKWHESNLLWWVWDLFEVLHWHFIVCGLKGWIKSFNICTCFVIDNCIYFKMLLAHVYYNLRKRLVLYENVGSREIFFFHFCIYCFFLYSNFTENSLFDNTYRSFIRFSCCSLLVCFVSYSVFTRLL